MKEIMNRIKSPVVLASLVSAVLIALSTYGIVPLTPELKALLDSIGYVVIGVGIFNNPTDRQNW